MYLLEDKEGKLTFEDIQKPEYQRQFKKSEQAIPNFNTTRSRIWVKLTVANHTDERIYLEVAQAIAWYIDFYKPDTTGKLALTTQTGLMRPMKNREVDNNFFLFELANNPKPQTYYFSIQSQFPFNIPLSLASKQAQMIEVTYYNLFFGGFLGLVLIMFFYNLFVACPTKNKLYLYYCGYLLTALWVNFISGNYAYLLNPISYFPRCLILLMALSALNNSVFVINLLVISKNTIIYRVLILSSILYIFLGVLSVFIDYYAVLTDIIQSTTLLTFTYILLYMLTQYIRGNKTVRFALFGFSFYLLSVCVYILQNFTIITNNFITNNAIIFGISLEILMFSFALADRINRMRREKELVQADLLQKTKENERILSEQNQILEGMVQERTEELQTMNEELNSNVEELNLTLEALEQQKQTIESINHKITSSVKYAQTIQSAILPTTEYLETHLPDYCLVYRPKDVVSGDFYWVHHLPNCIIVAVADCTGHGVAGSFMSLIGINLLDSMEQEMERMTPAEIIGKFNVSIEKALKQEERQSFNEGMDIAICKIFYAIDDKRVVEFAGAKRPLYYVPQNDKTLQVIEGDRKSVGSGINPPFIFTHHARTLAKNDMLYLCSDGFADQNNPKRKKFGENALRQLLVDCHDKPAEEQKKLLTDALDAHKQNAEQRDDITLLGIRV